MKKEWKGQPLTMDTGKQPSNESKDGINGQPGDNQEKYSPKHPPYGVKKSGKNQDIGR